MLNAMRVKYKCSISDNEILNNSQYELLKNVYKHLAFLEIFMSANIFFSCYIEKTAISDNL